MHIVQNINVIQNIEKQSVTYLYPEFLISLVVSEQIGTGKKFLEPGKVTEPVSEKFDTGTDFCCQNLGILKIYNGYRYRLGAGTENFSFFWWYRNRYRKNLVPEKSLGTGIGQIWYRKKVSEPVSEKFGTEKSTGIGIENI